MIGRGSAARWLRYRLGRVPPETQVTPAEHACLLRHAAGRRSLDRRVGGLA